MDQRAEVRFRRVPRVEATLIARRGHHRLHLRLTGTQHRTLGSSITYGVGNEYDSYRKDLWRRLDAVGLRPNFVGTCPTSAPEWKCQFRGTLGDYNRVLSE